MLLLIAALATMPTIIGPPMSGDLGMVGALMNETRPSATRIEVTVNPSGTPVHCAVTQSQGMPLLDRTACAEMMRRARFTPARDATGAPVVAVVREDFTVNSVIALRRQTGPAAEARQVDFAVTVASLPRPGAVLVTDLVVATDARGNVTTCDVTSSSTSAALDRIACREVQTTAFTPARDRADAPVAAVRAVSVGFTAQPIAR